MVSLVLAALTGKIDRRFCQARGGETAVRGASRGLIRL
jgi:hypothetical protein